VNKICTAVMVKGKIVISKQQWNSLFNKLGYGKHSCIAYSLCLVLIYVLT